MKISELTVRQGNVDVEGEITEVEEPRNFNKFGRELRVANAILKDDSGTVKLTLWNDEVDKFKAGDKVKVTNGYVNEFQGEKQLTAGKFGKMELSDGGSQEELPDEEGKEGSADESASEEAADEISEAVEDSEEDAEEESAEASEEPEEE